VPLCAWQCPVYAWTTGAWDRCSATCNFGTQRRAVACTTLFGEVVDAALCDAATKPTTARACDMGACAWKAGEWSDCSVMCGGGFMSRRLSCRNGGGNGDAVFELNCVNKPDSTARCNPQPCPAYYWLTTSWSRYGTVQYPALALRVQAQVTVPHPQPCL
jgi:hypothetical protein